VTRTARPPVLTPAQRRTLRHARAMQALVPKHVQGTPALRHPRPVSPPVAGAHQARPALSKATAAPTDFDYFRAQPVGPGTGQDSHNEPSVANDGNDVLYTGNFYAAQSTDSGHTFSFLNPFTLGPAPTLPNGGFCCNQVAIHAPTAGITAWGLMYCPANDCASGDNLIRLAVARNKADLDADAFDYYDFSAQTFGFPEGDWLGYPQLGVNNDSLVLTANVNNGSGPVDSILVKFNLAAFTTGTWSASWVFDNQDFTWTPVGNSGDSWTYWAATAFGNGSLIRVYNWPPNTDFTHVSWNDFSVSFNSATLNGSCPAPDSTNWCAFDDSRVKTGGEAGLGTVYFMWDAKEGGNFPFPYVEYASFDVSNGPATSISEHQIWNPNYAWAYPGLGIDASQDLGVSLQIGGGTWGFPGSQFMISDSATGGVLQAQFLDAGAHAAERWGDYLTSRVATTGSVVGDTWIATGYTLHDDGSGNAVTTPSFYWVGRNRNDPFAPSWISGDTSTGTEGLSSLNGAGVFLAPSNCACDYAAAVQWGDGTSSAALLGGRGPGTLGAFGAHAYAEEGTYTTATNVSDNWGATTFGTSSASVADAPLHAQGRNISGAVGVAGPWLAATFNDADPGGTLADYQATIHWGDGTSSPGTLNGNGSVTGTHAYARTGTYPVTTTVSDTGGATVTAASHASIGLLPTITSVSPSSGTRGGGTTVTITGTHFTKVLAVQFGNVAGHFTVKSGTKIVVTTPGHAAGTVDIRIITKFGASAITSHDKYKFT
jgi:IPT/TIG domain